MKNNHSFIGSSVALITPMFDDGVVDYEALNKLIDFHIDAGTSAIVSVGTTGESATVGVKEHLKIIDHTIKYASQRIPIIAGTGANSTSEAIDLTREAQHLGADACLLVTPYYNKPTQEGLYQHYKAINDKCGIPIIIYNIPGRSVIDMTVDTMARLFELKNIVGVKDATGDLDRVNQQKDTMGADFVQLTGNDDNALEFNNRGGIGSISVTANIAPKLCSDFQKASKIENDNARKEAVRLDKLLQPIHNSMFIESNPSPVKYAAKLLGLCGDDVRLPLVKVTEPTKEVIKKALVSANLI